MLTDISETHVNKMLRSDWLEQTPAVFFGGDDSLVDFKVNKKKLRFYVNSNYVKNNFEICQFLFAENDRLGAPGLKSSRTHILILNYY